LKKNVAGGEKFSHSGFKEGAEDMTDKGKEIGRAKLPL
jgi:hypothetical protein